MKSPLTSLWAMLQEGLALWEKRSETTRSGVSLFLFIYIDLTVWFAWNKNTGYRSWVQGASKRGNARSSLGSLCLAKPWYAYSLINFPNINYYWTMLDRQNSPQTPRLNFTYVQGMNVLAAPFLYTLPSELEAFYCFSRFIEVSCPLYVQPTLEGVHRGLKVWFSRSIIKEQERV